MIFKNSIRRGIFYKRPNRFEALVLLDDKETLVHVPNTGRCRELLIEGTEVLLEDRRSPKRKTDYELIMVYKEGKPVSIDSQLPNKLVEEAIINGKINEISNYKYLKKEVTYSGSRFDLFLKADNDTDLKEDCCFVEVKGVTLEKDSIAMFPDAPTERGARHIHELIKAHEEGYRAILIFVIQFEFADYFKPNYKMDPEFGKAAKEAYEKCVEILAYKCKVNEKEVYIEKSIEVRL
jgi:sugar fermentation stimulation protein A